jgi:hypothetical protein
VTFPVFKAGDAFLRGTGGGFDFHTSPQQIASVYAGFSDVCWVVKRRFSGLLTTPGRLNSFVQGLLALRNPLGVMLPHDLLAVSKH